MKITLKKREVVGKKVKTLRKEKMLPATMYGPGRPSITVMVDVKSFASVYKKAGHNTLIDIEIEGETKAQKALIKEVQVHPIKDDFIHVSFYQINMNKTLVTEVPVEVNGTSPAVKNNLGFLVTPIDALTVHCLPGNIPHSFEVNIDKLEQVGDTITVADITLPEGVEWDSSVNDSVALAYIAPPQKIIVEEEVAPAEGEEGATAEGEAGEAGTEEAKGEE